MQLETPSDRISMGRVAVPDEAFSSLQITRYQSKLLKRCFQVFHDLQGNHARCGQVVAIGQ